MKLCSLTPVPLLELPGSEKGLGPVLVWCGLSEGLSLVLVWSGLSEHLSPVLVKLALAVMRDERLCMLSDWSTSSH